MKQKSRVLEWGYKKIRNTSIFKRLMVSFLIVILIPNIVLVNRVYQISKNEFYASGVNYIYQNIDDVKQKVYERMMYYEKMGRKIAEDNVLIETLMKVNASARWGGGNHKEQQEYIENSKKINDYLYNSKIDDAVMSLQIITPYDQFIQKSNEGKVKGGFIKDINQFKESKVYGKTVTTSLKTSWFDTLGEDDIYESNSNSNVNLANYITVTHRIINEAGALQGLLIMNLDISSLAAINDIKKLYNQDMFLIGEKGIMTHLTPYYLHYEFPDNFWGEVIEKRDDIYQYSVGKEKFIVVVEELGKEEWMVASIVAEDSFMNNAYKIKKEVLGLTVATIIISLIICFAVTLSISYPLKKLQRAMNRFATEDFDTTYYDEGKDQIGEVSTRFNEMVERINDLATKQVQHEKMYFNALQMQINPHFLYNMLDIIRWNTIKIEKGNGKLSRMISGFSNMLKYNIKIETGYATIEEELAHTYKYVELIELLYDNEIEVIINHDRLELDKLIINKLIFQPIIENAVIHGKINKIEHPVIIINIITKGEYLVIDIMNNGKCIAPEEIKEINKQLREVSQEGIGLKNVNQRIKLLFGKEYGIYLGRREGKTIACIRLPLKYQL